MRRRRTKPQTKQGKRPTKTTPQDTETTTTRTNNKTTRTRGTKQRNTPPTRNRNTKPEKQKGHKTEKPKKPERKNETKNPHIKSIKKNGRYFSHFFYINALVGFWCSFEFWLVGLEVWAYKKLLWIWVPCSLVACSLVPLVLLLFGRLCRCFRVFMVSFVGLLPLIVWFFLLLNVVFLLLFLVWCWFGVVWFCCCCLLLFIPYKT